jgi:UDP-N-acetylmuramoyl-L-alanyl-D-glutamate--2,6-diaminopimelate ligase
MVLRDLLKGVMFDFCSASPEQELIGITNDSRAVRPGYLFVAVKGTVEDGHAYISPAVAAGASCVVAEDLSFIPSGVAAVRVPDSRAALTTIAMNFYRRPFLDMTIAGITGTNGKTTTSYLLESILSEAGYRVGVIGTVNYRYPARTVRGDNTTPDSLALMAMLREMADAGVNHVIMEVSSHALEQRRVDGCPFKVAVFTNLTRDHLDYHGTMDAYFKAKARIFEDLNARQDVGGATAVINADDPRGDELIGLIQGRRASGASLELVTFGLSEKCMVRPESYSVGMAGIRAVLNTPVGLLPVESSLIGRFNIYNILAAVSAAIALDIKADSILSGVSRLSGVPGRLERVHAPVPVLVDYAHTPDALQNILEALRPLTSGRLITVFGCGGDRDRGKRPEMGRIAGRLSDVVFITSDNPRSEDPAAIARQIEEGVIDAGMKSYGLECGGGQGRGYLVEIDRSAAIRKALSMALAADVVVIAGKGHEDYQIIGKVKRHFDDREAVQAALRGIK